MFERFTDRARRVVVFAQEEARDLGHNYIGTEHILLGLIRESGGVAAEVLQAIEISLDAVRREVQAVIGQGQEQQAGHIPFTPRAKKVLELSLREALQLGHNYIGTEHILLGLIREGDGVAARVLVTLGADLTAVRAQVVRHVHAPAAGPAGPAEMPGVSDRAEEPRPAHMRAVASRVQLEHLTGRVGEVLSRLDAIAERLARMETLLAEGRPARVSAPRKPPAAKPDAAASGAGPEPGQAVPEPGPPSGETKQA